MNIKHETNLGKSVRTITPATKSGGNTLSLSHGLKTYFNITPNHRAKTIANYK